MAAQSEIQEKRSAEAREKLIEELKRELSEYESQNEALKSSKRIMNDKLGSLEAENQRIKTEFKKGEKIIQSYDAEKEELSRNMNEKLKKYLKEKD